MNDVDTQDKSELLMLCWYSCNKNTPRIPVLLVIPNFHSTIHAQINQKWSAARALPCREGDLRLRRGGEGDRDIESEYLLRP